MPNLLWFEWEVSKKGYSVRKIEPIPYHWRQHRRMVNSLKKHGEEEEEIERVIKIFEYYHLELIPNGEEMIKYHPLDDNPELFMEFGSLKDTPGEYVKFANQYGLLSKVFSTGESLGHWRLDVSSVRTMLEDWKKCSNNGSLKDFIEEYSGWISGLEITLGRSFGERRPALYISPSDLGSAIRLQFFQAISSDIQFRRCAVCPAWFVYGTGTGRRKSAHYCSDRCRKAAFLERKQGSKA